MKVLQTHNRTNRSRHHKYRHPEKFVIGKFIQDLCEIMIRIINLRLK